MKEIIKPVSRSGRFRKGPAAEVARFSESVSFDWRLWEQDLLGSLAHAAMLEKVGLLTQQELRAITGGLEEIGREIETGKFRWRLELEDVHMNIEAELTRRVAAGAKLHTGRSRNDQVSLDMRMWLREQMAELAGEIGELQTALVEFSGKNSEVVIPGYTHLQRAQPVYLAHHLLAYVEMLDRDLDRLEDCFHRVNVCPLGAGAIAGTTLPLDRGMVAVLLGFVDSRGKPRLTQNSMDAVSDRDFVVEFCGVAALLAVHLSRFAEDLILWASAEFGFIRIGDAYTTGSSLMPQKKNPDMAELARGKAGRVVGNLVSVLTLLKGLPMTYNRDLQEDKERLFDSMDTVRAVVGILSGMLGETRVEKKACLEASADPMLLATDLADYLVGKGVAFREAHQRVGELVALSERLGQPLDRLSAEQLKSVDARFGKDAQRVFDLKRALAGRRLVGAPGTGEVGKQLARWRKALLLDRRKGKGKG